VDINNFKHKALSGLYFNDTEKGLPADSVGKLRLMLGFLQDMGDVDELRTPPTWKAHQLTGDRAGVWALHVTRNWRLTFRVDAHDGICDIDLEDDH